MDLRHAITREARISAVINGVLSAVFFLLVFGLDGEPVTTGAPDHYGFDFVIQGAIVALMAALVPSFLLRKKAAASASCLPSVARLIGFALMASIVMALISFGVGTVLSAGVDSIAYIPALALKVMFGLVLGFAITRSVLSLHFK
jgi:hypothetical protein